jgi:hypothetical protein
MEVNKELEEKLWSASSENHLGKSSIESLNYLVRRLENYLQTNLFVNTYQDEVDEESFCWTFKANISEHLFQPVGISFNGIIGMGLDYDQDKPHYSASLFLFGNGHRLTTKNNKSYIELFYEKQPDGTGEWRSLGWQEDEFWEFEDVGENTYGPNTIEKPKKMNIN